ncbi:LIM domain, partial [Acididesulfobacillus acetoxydans]
MNCERCGASLNEGEVYNYRGKALCEDCYVGALQPPKSCDVAAVHLAQKHREHLGETGTQGLTELQKDIYDYIKGV